MQQIDHNFRILLFITRFVQNRHKKYKNDKIDEELYKMIFS